MATTAGASAGVGAASAGVSVPTLIPSEHVTKEQLSACAAAFAANPALLVSQNALTRNALTAVGVDARKAAAASTHVFSNTVSIEGNATSQRASGRCWLFAALNVVRNDMMKRFDLPKSFELSQSYLFFWDKVERCNYFMNAIVETVDEPVDSRLVQHLLSCPVNDGGQWDMLVAIIRKYGVVPKSVYPDSSQATASRTMNRMLTSKLRQCGKELRDLAASGASKEDLLVAKAERMPLLYNIIAVSLGTPPTTFDWEYYDKSGKYHAHRDLTGNSFYKEFVPDLDDYVSLVHDPRSATKKLYSVKYLGNVAEAGPVEYLNVDIDTLAGLVRSSIEDNEPVWFGCDVGKFSHRDMGLLDLDILDYDGTYGTGARPDGLSKAERLVYGESLMTHAMVFTGFSLDAGGKVARFRVENSWGDKTGDKGYLTMTRPWFDEFTYQVVVHKRRLPDELRAIVDAEDKDVTIYPPWDPMGALARACRYIH